MDGGRVLRALLQMRMTRLRATELAVGVGTVIAGAFLFYGLLEAQYNFVFLAVVVYLLGQAELAMMRAREAGAEFRDRIESFFAVPDDEFESASVRPPSPGFSGLAWDSSRRGWVEWKNGVVVRLVPMRK